MRLHEFIENLRKDTLLAVERLLDPKGRARVDLEWTLDLLQKEMIYAELNTDGKNEMIRDLQLQAAGKALQLERLEAAKDLWLDSSRLVEWYQKHSPYQPTVALANTPKLQDVSVYVAGGFKDTLTIKEFIARLRAAGLVISLDWTEEEGKDRTMSDDQRNYAASEDLAAIDRSDFVWLLCPSYTGGSGAWTEFGYSLGRQKTVLVSGSTRLRTIFTSKASGFDTHEEAFAFLLTQQEHVVMARRASVTPEASKSLSVDSSISP